MQNLENPHAISRRNMLAGGLSALAAVPFAAAKVSPSPLVTTTGSAITTPPVVLGGWLLATAVAGLPTYVLESDRGTGFMPIYLEGPLPVAKFVGQHVTLVGPLSNALSGHGCPPPALVIAPTSIECSAPPSPIIPGCDQTLEDVPLTSDEAATVEQMLMAYINATSANPDSLSQGMIQDQAIQMASNVSVASYVVDIPFVFVQVEGSTNCIECFNIGELMEYLQQYAASLKQGSVPTIYSGVGPDAIAISGACALAILRLILGFLIGLIVAFLPARTIAAIEEQARALIGNPAVIAALGSIFKGLQGVIAGTLTGRDVGPLVVAGIQAMAAPLGAALLALCRTLSWAQYILAAARAAGLWIQVAIWVIRIAAVVGNLIIAVKTCAAEAERPMLPGGTVIEAPAVFA